MVPDILLTVFWGTFKFIVDRGLEVSPTTYFLHVFVNDMNVK